MVGHSGHAIAVGLEPAGKFMLFIFDLLLLFENYVADHLTLLFLSLITCLLHLYLRCEYVCIDLQILGPLLQLFF